MTSCPWVARDCSVTKAVAAAAAAAAEKPATPLVSGAAVDDVVGCTDGSAVALAPPLGAPMLFGGFVPQRGRLPIEASLQNPRDVRRRYHKDQDQ